MTSFSLFQYSCAPSILWSMSVEVQGRRQMHKAINHPAVTGKPTYSGVRPLQLSYIGHTGTWLYAGMVFTLTLRLRPEIQSCCRFFAMLWGLLLGHFNQSMNLLQGQNLLSCWLQDGILGSWTTGQPSRSSASWSTEVPENLGMADSLRSAGIVSPGADVRNYCMQ